MDFVLKAIIENYVNSVALNGVPVNYPQIDPITGHWRVFDPVANAWNDTGQSAEGKTPEPGANGNWWINGVDTGIPFAAGVATQVEMGGGITVSNALGGWKNGDSIDPADNVFDVLRRLLNPVVPPVYVQAVLSLAGSQPLEREIGEIISPTLTPTWNQNDGGELSQYRLSKGGTVVYTGALAIMDEQQSQLTTNVTYQAAADYGEGPVKNDSDGNPFPEGRIPAGTRTSNPVTYTPQRKAFYGVLTSEARPETSDEIRSLSGELLNPTNGSLMTVQVPAGAWGACFAYPATLRTPQSIISQASGLDVKTGTPETAVSVEGANGYLPINYRVFIIMGNIPYGGAGDTYKLTI